MHAQLREICCVRLLRRVVAEKLGRGGSTVPLGCEDRSMGRGRQRQVKLDGEGTAPTRVDAGNSDEGVFPELTWLGADGGCRAEKPLRLSVCWKGAAPGGTGGIAALQQAESRQRLRAGSARRMVDLPPRRGLQPDPVKCAQGFLQAKTPLALL
ncbi:hypothetical protein PMIN01_07708 [Paraphaeosphaeria minitans]|uniref:Uncharacterized protein n=1 Tax=Paraphaeosphaeria minitans TaxID=565426 RepID=A0A9P6GGY2_9PLEO|nr:hypothetical protein PMIN01_07708 [Paraphaeosphaeria minitans]